MKNWLIIINLLFFAPNLTFGQIAVRVFNFRPTGELGFVMKPTTSVEIAFQDRFSKRSTKRFRTGFSLQYISMKPRLDVFPVSGVGSDANGFRVLPGKQSFQKYAMIQMTGGMDYAFIHKEKLNVFAGFDIVGGMAAIEYELYYPGFLNEGYQGGGVLAGFRFRLGIEYALSDHFGLFINANRNAFLIAEHGKFGANDYGFGIRYSFD